MQKGGVYTGRSGSEDVLNGVWCFDLLRSGDHGVGSGITLIDPIKVDCRCSLFDGIYEAEAKIY